MKKLNILLALLLILSYVLTPFSSMAEGGFQDWKDTPTQVPKDKVWSVRLSQSVDPSSVNAENVFVEDESGEKLANQLSVEENNTLIKVQPPTGGYEAGKRYTLYIKDLRGADGKLLKQDIRMTFFVKGEVEIAEFKIAEDVVAVSEEESAVKVQEDGQTVQMPREVVEKNKIEIGSVVMIPPSKENEYGSSGRVVAITEQAGVSVVVLEKVPFYEIYESMHLKGHFDEFKVNDKITSAPGVTITNETRVKDGVKYQHLSYSFENTPVYIDDQQNMYFDRPNEISISKKGVLEGSVDFDLFGVKTDISYDSKIDVIKKRIAGFTAFDIYVNPNVKFDLKWKFDGELKWEDTLKFPEIKIGEAKTSYPGVTIPVIARPSINASASISAAASIDTHFHAGVRVGVRHNKTRTGLERYCEPDHEYYVEPKLEGEGNMVVNGGVDFTIGFAFLSKIAELYWYNRFGLEDTTSIKGTGAPQYVLNEKGNREWFECTNKIDFVYNTGVRGEVIEETLLDIPFAEFRDPLYEGKLYGHYELKTLKYPSVYQMTGSNDKVLVQALFQKNIVLKDKVIKKYPESEYSIDILPMPLVANASHRKITLSPEGILRLDEKTGKLSWIGDKREIVNLRVDFYGKTASITIMPEKTSPNPKPPVPPKPDPQPPTPPEDSDYPPKSEWTDAKWFRFNKETGIITDYLRTTGDFHSYGAPGDVVIPKYIEGVEVKIIGKEAFYNKRIHSLKIPNTVTRIRERAFASNDIKTLEIPNSVTRIDKEAFNALRLKNLKLSTSLKQIGKRAFASNQLEQVILPFSLVEMGEGAFEWNHLKKVELSSSLKKLEKNVFSYNKITDVVIPNSVQVIEEGAFQNNALTSLQLSNRLQEIQKNAFAGNKLQQVELPFALKQIGESAFANNNLTSMRFSKSVEQIGKAAFRGNQLSSVDFSDGLTTIGEEAFAENQLLALTLPDSVTEMGTKAFYKNNLEKVTLSKKLKIISDSVFANNDLEELIIPEWIEGIAYRSFQSNQLRKVYFPDGLKSIGGYAFSDNKLKEVEVPKDCTWYHYPFDEDVVIKRRP